MTTRNKARLYIAAAYGIMLPLILLCAVLYMRYGGAYGWFCLSLALSGVGIATRADVFYHRANAEDRQRKANEVYNVTRN